MLSIYENINITVQYLRAERLAEVSSGLKVLCQAKWTTAIHGFTQRPSDATFQTKFHISAPPRNVNLNISAPKYPSQCYNTTSLQSIPPNVNINFPAICSKSSFQILPLFNNKFHLTFHLPHFPTLYPVQHTWVGRASIVWEPSKPKSFLFRHSKCSPSHF
jgi:hypothetical protein